MKSTLLIANAALLIAFSSCKKNDPETSALEVKGSQVTIAWQECAFLTDHDMNICFVDAKEYRCPCDVECIWEGAVDATLHITTMGGIDTTITLTTNSEPQDLHSTAVVGDRVIRFVSTSDVQCSDYGNYDKYKVVIAVENDAQPTK